MANLNLTAITRRVDRLTGPVRWYRYRKDADVRVGTRPPKGWDAEAVMLDSHPITGRPLKNPPQWWIREEFAGE